MESSSETSKRELDEDKQLTSDISKKLRSDSENTHSSDDDGDWEEVQYPTDNTNPPQPTGTQEDSTCVVPPGVGFKLCSLVQPMTVVVKGICPATTNHQIIGSVMLDTSGSMSSNGGFEGLVRCTKMMAASARDQEEQHQEKRPKLSLSAATFDEMVTPVADGVFVPLDKWDTTQVIDPPHNESKSFQSLVLDSLHHRGCATYTQEAVKQGARAAIDHILKLPLESRDKSAALVLLCTDGQPNPPVLGSFIRHMIEDMEQEAGVCVQVCAISLGSDPEAGFLAETCGTSGIVGYAVRPSDAPEAVQRVLDLVGRTRDIFKVTYNVVRRNKHNGEDENISSGTIFRGFWTSNHTIDSFQIPPPRDGFAANDKIEVCFLGETYTIGPLTGINGETNRDDLLNEYSAIEDIRNTQTQLLANPFISANDMMTNMQNLVTRTSMRTRSNQVRHLSALMSGAVMRSLSSATTQQDDVCYVKESGKDSAYRSLGASLVNASTLQEQLSPTHVLAAEGSQAFY